MLMFSKFVFSIMFSVYDSVVLCVRILLFSIKFFTRLVINKGVYKDKSKLSIAACILLWWRQRKSQGVIKVVRNHDLGTINVCTEV